jgi:hypothetical protein
VAVFLSGKLAMDQLHQYTLLHTTGHKTVLRNTIRLPSLCIITDLYGFKCSNFVVLCTDDSHTPISLDTRLNDIYGDASERAPIHLTFLLNEHAMFAPASSFTRNLLLTICSLVDGLFILKALNTGHLLLNFQRHVNTISFFYGFRKQTSPVLHSPRIYVQQFTSVECSFETGRF